MAALKRRAKVIEAQAAPAESSYDDELQVLIGYFEDSEETSAPSRRLAERDRDYYDNKQLTAAERAVLAKRGQPDVVINRIQTKVNYLLGYEAAQRTDPRGYPRTPQDEDASEAATDSLRYVRDNIGLSQIFSQVWENMLIEGLGGAEFGVEPDGEGDADITGKAIHWDRIFWDAHAREDDFADARYKGLVVWMEESEAKARWPQGADAIARTAADVGNTYDDKPAWKTWATRGTRKRVQIVQVYHKKGDAWHWCIFTKGGKLASGEVPYKDQDNKSLCPLILQSAFVTRDNDRYGFVRALIGPQDEINKRRSKGLHLLMGKGAIMEDGAVDDEDATKTEMAKAHGLIKVNPGFRFDIVDSKQDMQGHLELLQESKNEIDLMGPNAAMQGKGERSASGRAIMANQQGGQIEIYRLTDRHNKFKKSCYELIWAMIQQYWSAHKMIRVTDDEKNVRFVGLNRPVLLAEDLLQKAVKNGVPEEQAKAQLAQQVQQDPTGQIHTQLSQVVRTENVPAEMTMDIILEEVPDAANMQQEQFEILAQLAPAGVIFPPKVYIKSSALRNKKELLEELEKAEENPEAQADAQARQQMQQLELQKGQAELKAMMIELQASMRKAAKDAADVDKVRADTRKTNADTMKAVAETDMLDAQIGQIQLPQVYGGQPWTDDLGQNLGMDDGMGGGGMPMGMPPPGMPQQMMGPPPSGGPPPPGPPPGLGPMGMSGGMPGGIPPPPPGLAGPGGPPLGPPLGEMPMGTAPGFPPPPNPGEMPLPPPQFNPREFQAPPPGGGY